MKLTYPYHNMYNTKYAKKNRKATPNLLLVQKRISRISFSNCLSQKSRNKIYLLFKRAQIRMEQDSNWLLEREENTILQTAKSKCSRFKKWSLEWRKKNRQRWICSNLETQTPKFRLPWIRERASINHRKAYWKIFKARGGSASC